MKSRDIICAALPRSQDDFIADQIIEALSAGGFAIVKQGTKCPFAKGLPDPGLSPQDPCPICGDLGTFDQPSAPSKCIG